MNQEPLAEKRLQFERALELFLSRIREDRYILAAAAN
jgi:hypothetical protein